MLLPSNISTNTLASPSNVEGGSAGLLIDVPVASGNPPDHQKNFALITSLIVCNKSAGSLGVYAKIVNGATSAFLLRNLDLPPGQSFEVINGNKFTLKEGDKLYVWHNSLVATDLDAIISYTLHRPLTTYDV
jgi:hypothetical protein